MNFQVWKSRPWCDLNLRLEDSGNVEDSDLAVFFGGLHTNKIHIWWIWYWIWNLNGLWGFVIPSKLNKMYIHYYRFDWGWLSKMYRFEVFFLNSDTPARCKRAGKHGGRGVAGGMMGMIWGGGLMTFRRYESKNVVRKRSSEVRLHDIYMLYIYNIHMETGKKFEVLGELLNFLLIDCYIFGPPHTTHTHIYIYTVINSPQAKKPWLYRCAWRMGHVLCQYRRSTGELATVYTSPWVILDRGLSGSKAPTTQISNHTPFLAHLWWGSICLQSMPRHFERSIC